MQFPEPFIYEPRGISVTSVQAADIVAHGGNCHQFDVNPAHVSPSLTRIGDMIRELRLTHADGEAYQLLQCIEIAYNSALNGGYGVGAMLGNTGQEGFKILQTAENERRHGSPREFTGHAEMRLVDLSTPYLQKNIDHTGDVAHVNLCPCPGCFGHMVDAHYPTVLVGSIDPKTGAAFLTGRDLQLALGEPRCQVLEARNIQYRFPKIPDADLRGRLLTLCWDVFHSTRKEVHKTAHAGDLKE